MEIKVLAEVYRIGIDIGLLTAQDAIQWADNIIEHMESPPYELIDLSLSGNESEEDICFKLSHVNGNFDEELPPKIILSLINELVLEQEELRIAVRVLDRFIHHLPPSLEWIEKDIHYLSDGYYLA